jgi:hypothetical protein
VDGAKVKLKVKGTLEGIRHPAATPIRDDKNR